jgi:hypothetical protein
MIIDRIFIASEYLSGNVIEIGALHNPLGVHEDAHVAEDSRSGPSFLRGEGQQQ